MVVLPGQLIALLTFPGVILHEHAHVLACRWRNIRVLDVTYFDYDTGGGHVRHQTPTRHTDAFWIATAPFFINTTAAIATALTAVTLNAILPSNTLLVAGIGLWLAISLGMHAFPSPKDATNLWSITKYEWRHSAFAALTAPVVVIIYVGHYLSYVYLDIIYAAAVVFTALTAYDSLLASVLTV